MSPLRQGLIGLPTSHHSSGVGGKPGFLSMFIPQAKAWGKCVNIKMIWKTITPIFRAGIVEQINIIEVLTPFWIEILHFRKHLILVLALSSNIFGNIIIHEKVNSSPYGISVPIKAFLNVSETDVHRFSLLYRPMGNIEYIEEPLSQMGAFMYLAEIPGHFVKREILEYYLLLEMSNQTREYFPSIDAPSNPIRIHIDTPDSEQLLEDTSSEQIRDFDIEGLTPNVVIISPKPGERVLRQDLFIALSYFPTKDVDPERVKVFLDNKDVSEKAQIDSTYLSIPSDAITPGLHTVRVNISNIYGQKFNDFSWSFTVIPGEVIGFGTIKKQSSRLWANYTGGRMNRSIIDIGELNYSYNVDLDWLQMEMMYSKSSLENVNSQPKDRYYIFFKNDFMKVKLGDSYPNIDEYGWNGKHIRGINFIFNRGPIYLNFVNGKTNRAVQGDPAQSAMIISNIDSTLDDWTIGVSRNNYTFQQDVSATKLKLNFGKKGFLDINYIKVQDNISTVSGEINNAVITLPDSLVPRINPQLTLDEYFINTGNNYTIRFDSLMNNYQSIFNNVDTVIFPADNWVGKKPKENFILGSNVQFGIDDSRILIKSGFSLSLLNQNKWNNIENISELDNLSYDIPNDAQFFEYINLDTSLDISQYGSIINFGENGQPLIPFLLKNDTLTVTKFLNLSSLNRYSKIQLRYLGHRVELGKKRHGPDYYSILNPFIRTNYQENYISDGVNLFQNKLLFYYKKSNIKEGLYSEQASSIKTQKNLFNISLYPGSGLPTFNFGFLSSHISNGLKKLNIISDSSFVINEGIVTETLITDTLDSRIDLISKQFNISMTNQFRFFGDQVVSLNLLRIIQEDLIAASPIQSTGYFPRNALSESYGINLKTVYNNYWESTLYFNSSSYEFGEMEHKEFLEQEFDNYQLRLIYYPKNIVEKLIYGIYYSTGQGANYLTQYNFNLGLTSEPFEKVELKMYLDYRIKYLGAEEKSADDIFFRASIDYHIK
ncbi:MAG: hypothetical protein H8E85_07550 [Candidatus Marinimicrobia bacterium]|nr:hypothetical protein [Candidatus Neomarinimicrobiota bacterium]